jgi:hypothetical protein
MGKAKDIVLKFISSRDGNAICKKYHYSKKVVPNSQLHIGVFYDGFCEGVMQFGPSMRKDLTITMVKDTEWNGFLELNRMAFSDVLPKNSESRALAIAHKLIKKHYPHIEWIISFADGTQCGDGTIYRAAGYYLTQIKPNTGLRINPEDGQPLQAMAAYHKGLMGEFSKWEKLKGFQLRYVYFLNPKAKGRLTVPILDYGQIEKAGASMYKGLRR